MTTEARATDIDTTPEAVERLAVKMTRTKVLAVYENGTLEQVVNADGKDAAATLRALSARLAEVEAGRSSLRTMFATTYEDLAAAEARLTDEERRIVYIAAGLFPGGFDNNVAAIRAALARVKGQTP